MYHRRSIRLQGYDYAQEGASLRRKPNSLGSIIAGFKSAATKRINEFRKLPRTPVWQSPFYEHIVRDEADLNRIRQYIAENPTKRFYDDENPGNQKAAS